MPHFGTLVLLLVLVSAAFAFATAVASGRGNPRLLQTARLATYATCAFVALGVLSLAYAFITHDFRIRYVHHYSDRSMPLFYLVTSLWGGQDGSILWWVFILCVYTFACVWWLRGRYTALQPYVLATLMALVMTFTGIMLFAANPFSMYPAGAPPDGRGLNPLLQNFYMIFHPPSLYTGFVGCSVPFAFAVAALATRRLDEEWIYATRRWTLIAWLFLSIGNLLGALWAYEELGWGGFWAWDPVENAAIMPWFTTTAFLHSVMIQERRAMLKVWNVFLIVFTFFMTIFGTALTRTGAIASVHSFAQSNIKWYFVSFLVAILLFGTPAIIARLEHLKAKNRLDSILSREAAFLGNNWILVGIMLFIVFATTFPLLSEWTTGEKLTVGASFYNKWLRFPGWVLLSLTGIGPLIGWRRQTGANLARTFRIPLAAGLVVAVAQALFGSRIGFPAIVALPDEFMDRTVANVLLGNFARIFSWLVFATGAFVLAAIAQEFAQAASVRMRKHKEGVLAALANLFVKNRRRYGGYVVHVGVVLVFFGLAGQSYKSEHEAALHAGESFSFRGYQMTFRRFETEVDANKRMLFAVVDVRRDGQFLATLRPAKYMYRTHPEMPTTEIALRPTLREDLYLIVGAADPVNHVANIKATVNPLTMWLWIGGLVLIFGCVTAMWPEVRLATVRGRAPFAATASTATARALGPLVTLLVAAAILAAPRPARAQSPTSGSGMNGSVAPLPVGTVEMRSAEERRIFSSLLCKCGDCARLPLSTCTCSFAERTRAQMRLQIAGGESSASIIRGYVDQFGEDALVEPPDRGFNRLAWALPLGALVAGGVAVVWVGRRWAKRAAAEGSAPVPKGVSAADRQAYERRIADALRQLDE